MRGKLWFALGAAAGFVLGARAGREKYDELVLNARKVWDHPTVQEAAGVVQAQASRVYQEGRETVTDKISNSKLAGKLPGTSESGDASTTSTGTGTTVTAGKTRADGSPNTVPSTGSTY